MSKTYASINNIIKGSYFIVIAFFICLLFACQPEDKTPMLIGKWKGVSWKANQKDSGRNAADVRFEFFEDNTYTAAYGGDAEKGTFRLRFDGKLFTTASGQNELEKSVLLAKITPDTLIMNMNRVGTPEQLILVKK